MKKGFQLILIAASVFFISCNNAATDSDKNNDTTAAVTNDDTSSMPVYDAAMDPLTVEAQYAEKLGDTLNVKMYELTFKPGDSIALHTHPDHTVYVLQGGKLLVTPQGGEGQELDLKTGMGLILAAETHSGKNVGKTTIRLVLNDIYRPRGNR